MNRPLVVDVFCGGGGASLGIFWATGQEPDAAINHDFESIRMHEVNHPLTKHYKENVRKVSPREVTQGKDVGLAWFSPDCTHHSRAKGSTPVKKEIRSLAWIVIRWAREVKPSVIMLENVREFESWGPLIHQKIKGRLQYLPNGSPALVPDPSKSGHSFKQWAGRLKALGYEVQWRVLNAADYGAPTRRLRLFLVARCDGHPIVWPSPTHGDPAKSPGLVPWRTAAECIDWDIPCHSIFLNKEEGRKVKVNRPLAENTLRRIAMGVKKYVLDNPKPFIVQLNRSGKDFRGQAGDEPLGTITSKHGHALVTPHIAKFRGNSPGSAIDAPLPTVTAGAGAARPAGAAHAMGVVSAFLSRLGQTGGNGGYSSPMELPLGTITSKNEHLLIVPHLVPNFGERPGQAPRTHTVEDPMPAVTGHGAGVLTATYLAKHFGGPRQTSGQKADQPLGVVTTVDHHAVVEATFSPYIMTNTTGHSGAGADEPLPTQTTGNHHYKVAAHLARFNHDDHGTPLDQPLPTVTSNNHAALVYASLTKYYGADSAGQGLNEPLHTIRTNDCLGLVLVTVDGEPYVIVDICMRMLTPRELARAQGFPDRYFLTGPNYSQVARIGNSVSPQNAMAVVAANWPTIEARKKRTRDR
jgi:DNA (cytosine-5)-methyltransferase 1